MTLFLRSLGPALIVLAFTAASTRAGDLDEPLRLNTTITVEGDSIHLGDIFSGYLARPEKAVAQAPHPGQRLVLTSEWLNTLARTYGLNWHPAGEYDRAVVSQPGKTVAAQDILTVVRRALTEHGLPANYAVRPSTGLSNITIPAGSPSDIGIREAFFDAGSKVFSVVVEIPAGDPKAIFIPLHGAAYPVISVPVFKESVPKNTIITAAMLTTLELRAEQVRNSTITDPALLIGKSPKYMIRDGLPIQESEVAAITLVQVPVLITDMSQEAPITKFQVKLATFNAADLPSDVILDAQQLTGKTPRRFLPGGAPIRRGDVQLVRMAQVPVPARDLPAGKLISTNDISWVAINDAEVAGNILVDLHDIVGRATKYPLRSGQMLHAFDIARPTAVERGELVTIIYNAPMMKLTVQGLAMEQGGIGDVIRVTNNKTNAAIVAEVLDAHTVRLASHQTASVN